MNCLSLFLPGFHQYFCHFLTVKQEIVPALSAPFTEKCCLKEIGGIGKWQLRDQWSLGSFIPSMFDWCSISQFWKRKMSGLEGPSVIVLDLRLRGSSTAKGFAEIFHVIQADIYLFWYCTLPFPNPVSSVCLLGYADDGMRRIQGKSFILWVFPVWFYGSFLCAWSINKMLSWTGVVLGDEISPWN